MIANTVFMALSLFAHAPNAAADQSARTAVEDEPAADVAGVPCLDLRAGGVEEMRFFLIGGEAEPVRGKKKKLLLTLPGGTGSADFRDFSKRIWKNILGDEWLLAQLVAPVWTKEQAEKVVWPTATSNVPEARFSTEEFLLAVIAAVEERFVLDLDYVFTLSWSSGGPPCYRASLLEESRLTGCFVAMAVYPEQDLPSRKRAKGMAYYLLHSPEDWIPIAQAQRAREDLAEHGAAVELVEYAGGHGWHGDIFGQMRAGVKWLEEHHAKAKKAPKRKAKPGK